MAKMMSAQSISSAETGVSASGAVPAESVSTPSRPENSASAVGLRRRFLLQTNRTCIGAPNQNIRMSPAGIGANFKQAQFAGKAFEPGARGRHGRNQRQAHSVGGAAHQVEHGLHRPGVRLPEICLEEPSVAAFELAGLGPVIVQCSANHARHLRGNFVGGHADESLRADADGGQGEVVVAGEDLEARGSECTNSVICGSLPLASLMAWMFGAASARRTTVSGSRFTPVRPGTL